MKRNLLLLPLIGFLSLSSCKVNTQEGNVFSWNENDFLTLSFENEKFVMERGSYLTLKVDVQTNKKGASKKVDFVLQQDGKFIDFESESKKTDGTISISGKNIGIAKLTAVSVDNPSVSASVSIQVIKRIPSLSDVWQNVNAECNYSLLTKTIDKKTKESLYSSELFATENALLFEGLTKKEGQYYSYPLFEDNSDHTFVLGYGIDKNGYAYEIHLNAEGEYVYGSDIIKTERGFLNQKNFHGYKEDSLSINDVGFFYGLESINPDWLDKAKALKNTYEIGQEDIHDCYVKYLLWGLIDPLGRLSYLKGHPMVREIEKLVSIFDLTIRAETYQTLSFTLSYSDDVSVNSGNENYIFQSHMTNIGTTTLKEFAGLEDFLSGHEAKYPALNSTLTLLEEGIAKNDYLYQRELYWINPKDKNNPYQATFSVYYTPKYIMAYFSQEMVDAYHQATGNVMNVSGIGFLKAEDGIHSFEYFPSSEEKIKVGSVINNTEKIELWQCDFTLTNDYWIPNYLSYSDYFKNKVLNSLSDVPAVVFNGLPAYYYTHNKAAFDDFCMWYRGEKIEGSDFYNGINVTLKRFDTALDKVSFFAAYSEDSISYKLLFTPTLSCFGNAENYNEANDEILEAIERI